jgi:3,4-dihydroxy-2-butanone 4-phosphate synthase
VAVICEVLHDDGSPARLPYLTEFASGHLIAMVSVDQIAEYRLTLDDTDAYGMRTPLLL